MRHPLLLLLAVVLSITSLEAQQSSEPRIGPGDRIRLTPATESTAPGSRPVWVEAVVTAIGPESVTFEPIGARGQVQERRFTSIDTLAVRHRSRSAGARSGARWGAFLGGSAGLIAGPFLASRWGRETGGTMAATGAAGAAAGSLLGAAVGAVLNPGRWTRYAFEP